MSFQKTQLGVTSWAGWANYERIFHDPTFWVAWRNTLEFTVLALIVGYAVPFFVAILLNELRHARGYLRCLVYLPVMLPPTSALLLFAYFYDPTYGLFNDILAIFTCRSRSGSSRRAPAVPSMAMISVVIAATWMNMGGATLIYLAALQNIPGELYEAAELDGAGLFRKIRHITIPQTRLILSMLLLLQIVATMQMFVEAFILTNGGAGVNNNTVSVVNLIYQYAFALSGASNYNSASALGVVLMLVLAVFSGGYLWLTRRPGGYLSGTAITAGQDADIQRPAEPAARARSLPGGADPGRGDLHPGLHRAAVLPVQRRAQVHQEAVQVPPTIIPAHVHPGTYASAWSRVGLGRLLVNTLYYAFGALFFQLIFDVAAAYSLSRLRPVLGNLIFALMLATLMIPSTVLLVPQYVTVANLPILHLNLIGSPAAIWLPSVANAFNIFLLKRFFDSIPTELLAAAAIDGASPLRTLRSVVLPISRPILGVVSIFGLVAVWKDFLWPLLVEYGYNPSRETLNVGIFEASSTTPQNLVLAASAMAAVPTLIFFLIFQRNILSGLTAGSLKG